MHVKRFVELIERSGLASERQVRDALARLAQRRGGKLPSNVEDVATYFVEDGLLTSWQVSKLVDGKYQGFFLGKYKLLGHLGSGGMSSVYLAEHTVLHQRRAIKVLPRRRIGESSYLERFLLEARATAKLDHPNIVRAYDVNQEGDTYYIVMEYVTGMSMQQIVRESGPQPFERVARFIAQAATGLEHAHQVGLVHRDIKPANLLVTKDDQVKVLDLGLALLDDDRRSSVTLEHNETVLGTADYLAPEQALSSHDVDHRADLYSLGCTMYCLLVGQPPFRSGSLAQRLAMHQSQPPPPITAKRPDCPEALIRICMRLLEKAPDDRYQSAAALARDLQTWLETGAQPDWCDVRMPVAVAGENRSETARRAGRSDPMRRRTRAGRRSNRSGWWQRVASWAPFRKTSKSGQSDTLTATAESTSKSDRLSGKTDHASKAPNRSAVTTSPTSPSVAPAAQPSNPGDSGRIELGIEVFAGSGSLPRVTRRRNATPWWLLALLILASLALLVGLMYALASLG